MNIQTEVNNLNNTILNSINLDGITSTFKESENKMHMGCIYIVVEVVVLMLAHMIVKVVVKVVVIWVAMRVVINLGTIRNIKY